MIHGERNTVNNRVKEGEKVERDLKGGEWPGKRKAKGIPTREWGGKVRERVIVIEKERKKHRKEKKMWEKVAWFCKELGTKMASKILQKAADFVVYVPKTGGNTHAIYKPLQK